MRIPSLTSTLLLCLCLKAQITIYSTDMPAAGDTFHAFRDNLPVGFSVGPKGANVTWDFSGLMPDMSVTTYAVSPASTPYAADFPNANLALTNDHVGYIFYRNTSTALKVEGFSTVDASLGTISVNYNPIPDQYRFPATYLTNFSGSSGFQEAKPYNQLPPAIQDLIDSLLSGIPGATVLQVRVTNTSTYKDTIDAWGKVITPIGTYDALRRKRMESGSTVVEAQIQLLFPPTPFWYTITTIPTNTTEHSWLTTITKVPLITLSYDTSQNIIAVNYSKTPPPPVADFTWNNSSGGTVNFTNASENSPATFSWSFGDGGNSTLENPSHNYSANGTYNVCLTVANESGNDTYCEMITVSGIASATITTGIITGSPLCPEQMITVPYTVTGTFNSGNTFTAQLSDAAGSFASPTDIGSLGGTLSGSIDATIPLNTPFGTGYRIRVVSSDPVVTGTDNGADLEIAACGPIGCTALPSVTPASCTPLQLPGPGLSDSLTCVVRGEQVSVTIYFQNFDTVSGITIEWLRIDSLTNLPCGLALAMNDPDHTYVSGENGCMTITGLTNDSAGEYRLGIWITVKASILPFPLSGEAGALSQQFGGPPFVYYVTVKNPGDPCPSSTVTVSGKILSQKGNGVRTVTVDATGSSSQTYLTDTSGTYTFIFSLGDSVTITPAKANDSSTNNGITTLDIVLTRRHLLAVQAFETPYKIIAADVNSSKSVTTLDIVYMRSVVLQVNTTFPGGKLWSFVPDDYIFPDPQDPFASPFPGSRTYNSLGSDMTGEDFVAMKLGDVNNDWNPRIAKTEAMGEVQFAMDEYQVMSGQEIVVPVKVKDFKSITGYQFTLSWNPEVLEFLSVKDRALETHYGTTRIADGFLTTSWNDDWTRAVTLDEDETVFELRFKVIGRSRSFTEIKISSELTKSEAYNENLDLLSITSLNGRVKVGDVSTIVNLQSKICNLSIQPNPFSTNTQIKFSIPKDETISLVIYDIFGKEVKRVTGNYRAGEHRLDWDGTDGTGNPLFSGMYQIKMTAGGYRAAMNAVLIK